MHPCLQKSASVSLELQASYPSAYFWGLAVILVQYRSTLRTGALLRTSKLTVQIVANFFSADTTSITQASLAAPKLLLVLSDSVCNLQTFEYSIHISWQLVLLSSWVSFFLCFGSFSQKVKTEALDLTKATTEGRRFKNIRGFEMVLSHKGMFCFFFQYIINV